MQTGAAKSRPAGARFRVLCLARFGAPAGRSQHRAVYSSRTNAAVAGNRTPRRALRQPLPRDSHLITAAGMLAYQPASTDCPLPRPGWCRLGIRIPHHNVGDASPRGIPRARVRSAPRSPAAGARSASAISRQSANSPASGHAPRLQQSHLPRGVAPHAAMAGSRGQHMRQFVQHHMTRLGRR